VPEHAKARDVKIRSLDWDLEGMTKKFAEQWWHAGITTAWSSSKAPDWMKNKRDAAWKDYREESEQIIRAAIVRAEKTHNRAKGTRSTHAGYAVVEDLNAWVKTLNKEIPKDPPPEASSRDGKRKTTESDEKDDPETYRADGTLRAHSATQGTIRLNEGVGQTDVFPSDADDRQTRSRSAGEEVEGSVLGL
jgi:hypothetical protein